MARSATIRLDDVEYKIFPFDIGQLERFTDAMGIAADGDKPAVAGLPKEKIGLFVLKLALETAEPPIPDGTKIRASTQEVTEAVQTILKLAGLQQTGANPPAAVDAQPQAAAA
jgi:hypothetical protein